MDSEEIYYKLDADRNTIPCNFIEWAEWFNENPMARIVENSIVLSFNISTVFLGIDHSFKGGPPELFETMVFDLDGKRAIQFPCVRHATWNDAVAGHADIVHLVRDYRE